MLSEKTGFYFCLFMGTVRGDLRCRFDGGDETHFFTVDELVKLSQEDGPDLKVAQEIREAANSSSVYVWDVDGHEVIKQNLKGSSGNLSDMLNQEMIKKHPDGFQNEKKLAKEYNPAWGGSDFFKFISNLKFF